MNLAEDQFQQFPEGFGFLQALVACNVVVATPEGEQQRIGGRRLQLVEARALGVFVGLAVAGQVGDFLVDDLAAYDNLAVAESFEAVGPHSVGSIRAGRKVAVQLANPLLAVAGFDTLRLAFDEDVAGSLLVFGIGGKDGQIGARFAAAEPQREFDGDILLRIAILADQRFGDFLPDVFFGGFFTLRLAVDEVQYLALLDNDGGWLMRGDHV